MKLCSDNNLNFPECVRAVGTAGNGCAGSSYAYTFPVGVNSTAVALKQRTGFEADATMTGTASECESGQALQLTITSNEAVSKPKVLATPSGDVTVGNYTVTINNDQRYKYPDVGAMSGQKPLYGADSYTDPAAADLLMQRTADHLKWWDNTDQEKVSAWERPGDPLLSYVKEARDRTAVAVSSTSTSAGRTTPPRPRRSRALTGPARAARSDPHRRVIERLHQRCGGPVWVSRGRPATNL